MKKRKGKFRKSRLKLKDGNRISLPSGQWQKEELVWRGLWELGCARKCGPDSYSNACCDGLSCSVDDRHSGELFIVSDRRVCSHGKPTGPKPLKAWQPTEALFMIDRSCRRMGTAGVRGFIYDIS